MVSTALTKRKTLWGGPPARKFTFSKIGVGQSGRGLGIGFGAHFVVDYVNVQQYFDDMTKKALIYLGSVVRRQAMRSIRTTKYKASEPYRAANTRPPRIWKNTINRNWDNQTFTCVVGHKYDGFHERSSWETGVPEGGKKVPQLLEYGGYKRVTKPIWMPAKAASMDRRKREVERRNKMLQARGPGGQFLHRMTPPPGGKFTVSNLKTVPIWPGRYRIQPRPTMRLAFNKMLIQRNDGVIRAFRNARITDPGKLRKNITGIPSNFKPHI